MKRFTFPALFAAMMIIAGASAFAEKGDPGANIMTTVNAGPVVVVQAKAADTTNPALGTNDNPQMVVASAPGATLPTKMKGPFETTGGANDQSGGPRMVDNG